VRREDEQAVVREDRADPVEDGASFLVAQDVEGVVRRHDDVELAVAERGDVAEVAFAEGPARVA
jgi:hypothetical protein